jgi:hypothetical protein
MTNLTLRLLYVLVGVLLGAIAVPQFTVYEVTDIVWVTANPTRQVMLDGLVCYYPQQDRRS